MELLPGCMQRVEYLCSFTVGENFQKNAKKINEMYDDIRTIFVLSLQVVCRKSVRCLWSWSPFILAAIPSWRRRPVSDPWPFAHSSRMTSWPAYPPNRENTFLKTWVQTAAFWNISNTFQNISLCDVIITSIPASTLWRHHNVNSSVDILTSST